MHTLNKQPDKENSQSEIKRLFTNKSRKCKYVHACCQVYMNLKASFTPTRTCNRKTGIRQ